MRTATRKNITIKTELPPSAANRIRVQAESEHRSVAGYLRKLLLEQIDEPQPRGTTGDG